MASPMSERVTLTEVGSVSLAARCAWGAVCAEAVTRLYSSHFQRVFDPETAYSLIWELISTGTIDSQAVKRYIRRCTRLGKTDEAYDYGLPNGMLAALVAETQYPEYPGASVVECVGFCARMYPQILFFRHGIDDRMANIRHKHINSLLAEYHRFSRSVYEFVIRYRRQLRRDECMSRFVLDRNSFKLPRDLYNSKPPLTGRTEPLVPVHEVMRSVAESNSTAPTPPARRP